MKKIIILILIVGCLLSCQKPVDLYTGRLIKVEYSSTGGLAILENWVLTFIDGQIWAIHKQPKTGFKLGQIYTIYENKDGYLRAKRVR